MSDRRNMTRVRGGVQSGSSTIRRLLVAALLLVGCGATGSCDAGGGAAAGDRGAIVVSIFPVADLVSRIAGPDVPVVTLLGPGASPATFDPTPAAVRRVERARLVVSVGGGLDAWTGDLLEMAPGARSVVLLEGLPLLDDDGHGEGTGNPHVWLDPVRTRDLLLPRVADAVRTAFPESGEEIDGRSRAVADSLTALDDEIRRATASLPHRAFVASHAAWTYYAERYGLDQVGVIHEHPGQESSPRELASLVRRARESGVPVVFRESQIPDVGARALADELGVPVVPLDPLGGPDLEGRDSYLAVLRYNTGQFVLGLGSASDARVPRATEP